MKSVVIPQDVRSYYKRADPVITTSQKTQTAFSAEVGNGSGSYSGYSQSPKCFYSSGSSNSTSQQTTQQSPSQNYESSNQSSNCIQCNIVVNLQNAQEFSAPNAKEHITFLASILESYEGLVTGRIGNYNMTKEDYDKIDPKEMELINIRWCMASVIRRAQIYMELTGNSCIGGLDTKLGFDKSKVTCFRCKEKGHFKRECTNKEVKDDNVNPFRRDCYHRAIQHKNSQSSSFQSSSRIVPIEDGKSNDKALVVN
ncbi:putative transcription factor interactor and regulator CCHC(Zn) family [Helianthus annuus]|uniref:Transcription factor interactor and regulator CCHC(Zn) family n=1 Tax=Helianthus annuus TaxID=4232 RepID=A0A9K3IHZ2_HELAN|nr:putative transcription factor interactor and regulator CCHC(Zn) family [Helianthus annuus]KAJ0539958.1 putative transcription factor interactor and regulator CCHC(Zn) family [Helianthus annuus]KAJ0554698.1 putative transcription factor interactor and regulator CCHC(Zn) family [Helianthus annuus]KAJ0720262.1 putative transcription factor interactor and regulator CCHC(Zn) family [Helianthus annuus]KAJ0723480.1 putative transcription factor interactor and regulator CCHC(Zn) family [Helianthus a